MYDLQGLLHRTRVVLEETAATWERASPELAFATRLARATCERFGSRVAWALDHLAAMELALGDAAPVDRAVYCNARSVFLRAARDFAGAQAWARRGVDAAQREGLRAVGANAALSLGAALWLSDDRAGSFLVLEGAWREATAAGCPVIEASAALSV